jgi:argininosuccinate lyase
MSNSQRNPRALRTTFLATSIALALTATATDQKQDDFYWLGEINKASAVMLVEQSIVPKPLGRQIANAVTRVLADAEKPGALRSGDYLKVEQSLIAVGGPEMTRIHSGRSRQDIGATSRRLFMREDLLDSLASLNNARGTLLKIAAAHLNAIIPAYTWGVPGAVNIAWHYLVTTPSPMLRR